MCNEAWVLTDEFKEWQDVLGEDSECKACQKIDCIQHIGKCFPNKLEDLAKKGSKAPDGNSLYNGKNRLSPKARQYFGNSIQANVCPGVLST